MSKEHPEGVKLTIDLSMLELPRRYTVLEQQVNLAEGPALRFW